MKPRFRAECVVAREELLILASCLLRPMTIQCWRSSELEDLQSSRKRFSLEHHEGDLCWSRSESEGRKEIAECHLTEDRDKWRKYVHGVANPRIEDG